MIVNNFNSTVRIAKIELNSMFYSPVAWLVLVIFAFQVGMTYADIFDGNLHTKAMGYSLFNVTAGLFNGMNSVFSVMTKNLYLYIPLLTMGLMSREYQSGSIKLLYSSPITNGSIIMGKFMSMVIYGAALMSIMGFYVIFSNFTVVNFDLPMVLTGMLGLYLLLLAYSAIGLFMSTLTSYQVVAAIGTLAVLAFLNFVGGIGQEINFVRDLTYWLSMSGRTYNFINGLISSEDVIYYVVVITLFIVLSTLKLNAERNKLSFKVMTLKYAAVLIVTLLVGFVTSRAQMKSYYDATYTKENTLAVESQEVMKGIDGGMKITTYVNILADDYYVGLPSQYTTDYARFEKFIRFNPEIKMDYVYYYDKCHNPGLESRYPGLTDQEKAEMLCKVDDLNIKDFLPPTEIRKLVDLSSEKNKFVRIIERENGQKASLRLFNDTYKHPDEAEIAAAFKRFTTKAPLVAFLQGDGERELDNYGSKGYYLFAYDKWYRQSLLNQGFDIITLDLSKEEISNEVSIIVIAEPKKSFSDEQIEKINRYIDKGGNLFILGDYGRQENMNKLTQKLGVKFLDGVIANKNDYFSGIVTAAGFTKEAAEAYPSYVRLEKYNMRVTMPTAVALDYSEAKDFNVIPVLITESERSWIEKETTNFADDEFVLNTEAGEVEESNTTLITMSRKVGEKEQRIVISGDADCISNDELLARRTGVSASNYSIITSSFRWLSDDEFPINTQKILPIDNDLTLDESARSWVKIVFNGVIPVSLILMGLFVIIWRQRK